MSVSWYWSADGATSDVGESLASLMTLEPVNPATNALASPVPPAAGATAQAGKRRPNFRSLAIAPPNTTPAPRVLRKYGTPYRSGPLYGPECHYRTLN
jgi:hypothetical protein